MTTLPAAGCFTDENQTNLGAKQAQDDMLAFLAQLPGGAARSTLTIASGAVLPTAARHLVDTEGAGAADDLANITQTNLPDGSLLVLSSVDAGRVVTLKHAAGGAGQLSLIGSADLALASPADGVLLERSGTSWVMLCKLGAWSSNLIDGLAASAARAALGLVIGTDIPAYLAGSAEAVRRAWLPASSFTPTTTNGATTGTNEYATNDIMADYLIFPGDTEKFAALNLVMPPEWNRGTVKFKFYWAPGDAACTAGDTVEWEVAGGSLSDGDTIDAALGTAQVISDTVLAGKNAALHISGATPALTIAGSPALGDFIPLKISRNVSGTDDMTEPAWLFGVVIEYSVSNAVVAW